MASTQEHHGGAPIPRRWLDPIAAAVVVQIACAIWAMTGSVQLDEAESQHNVTQTALHETHARYEIAQSGLASARSSASGALPGPVKILSFGVEV